MTTMQLDLISAINLAAPTPRASVEMAQGLDLYCCGGGAGVGYNMAGANMTGVDVAAMGRVYPFRFIQADAIQYLIDHGQEYDFVHASPPCQFFSIATPQALRDMYPGPETFGIIRAICAEYGLPLIMENVERAQSYLDLQSVPTCDCYDFTECEHELADERLWRKPIQLCGSMFGLQVIRHRYFEVGAIAIPQPVHPKHDGSIAGGEYITVAGHGADNPRGHNTIASWQKAMGMPWVRDRHTLAEALPPAYTKYLGTHLLAWL